MRQYCRTDTTSQPDVLAPLHEDRILVRVGILEPIRLQPDAQRSPAVRVHRPATGKRRAVPIGPVSLLPGNRKAPKGGGVKGYRGIQPPGGNMTDRVKPEWLPSVPANDRGPFFC